MVLSKVLEAAGLPHDLVRVADQRARFGSYQTSPWIFCCQADPETTESPGIFIFRLNSIVRCIHSDFTIRQENAPSVRGIDFDLSTVELEVV